MKNLKIVTYAFLLLCLFGCKKNVDYGEDCVKYYGTLYVPDLQRNHKLIKGNLNGCIRLYNNGSYSLDFIKSIDEKNKNIEYIIIDGNSDDGTIKIVKKYRKKISYIIKENDEGMYDAIKKGFSRGKGKYFFWVNSDDLLFKNAIKDAVNIMEIKNYKWTNNLNYYIFFKLIVLLIFYTKKFKSFLFNFK